MDARHWSEGCGRASCLTCGFDLGEALTTELVELLDSAACRKGPLFRSRRVTPGRRSVDRSDAVSAWSFPWPCWRTRRPIRPRSSLLPRLQEYDAAAVVVGEQTYWEGDIFKIRSGSSDGSAVAISAGKYFTPEGVSLSWCGRSRRTCRSSWIRRAAMRSTRGSWRGRKIYGSRRQSPHWRRLR